MLAVTDLQAAAVIQEEGNLAEDGIAERCCVVLNVAVGEKRRVERWRRSAQLDDDAATGVDSRTGAESAGVDGYAGEADAEGAGSNGRADAPQEAAAFGAPKNLAGEEGPVALNGDIDVVFERECDHVLGGEIEIASADQSFEPGRVGQVRGLNYAAFEVKRPKELFDLISWRGSVNGNLGGGSRFGLGQC